MITLIIKTNNAKSISNQFALLTQSGRVNLELWIFSIILSSLLVSIPYFCKSFQNTFGSSDLSTVQKSIFCFWVIDKNLGGIVKYFVTTTAWFSSFTWLEFFTWKFKNGSSFDDSLRIIFGTKFIYKNYIWIMNDYLLILSLYKVCY